MTMQSLAARPISAAALVTKSGFGAAAAAEYLQLGPDGAMRWVRDPSAATPFPSMRDATRMAMRLPSGLRAYSLPREVELALASLH